VLLHPSLSHLDVDFGPTTPATTVDDTGLDTDARWNTVLALIRPGEFTKPLAYSSLPPWITAAACPGTPVSVMKWLMIESGLANAFGIRCGGMAIRGRRSRSDRRVGSQGGPGPGPWWLWPPSPGGRAAAALAATPSASKVAPPSLRKLRQWARHDHQWRRFPAEALA